MLVDQIPLPPQLVTQIQAGRIVPFLGAGMSRAAKLPDWADLLRGLVAWAESAGITLNQIDLLLQEIDNGQFAAVAHSLSDRLGDKLSDGLRSILAPPGTGPTDVHRRLADVVWPAVITTNFDNLIPESFKGYKILTWKDQQAIGDVLKAGDPHVMMAHGWIDRPDSIVLTPQQYRESFHNPGLRLYREVVLSHYSILFLGVSLRDDDLKYFLDELRSAFGPPAIPHFAFLPADQVTDLDAEHFRANYGIQTIRYQPTTEHPEVAHFVNLVIDQVPKERLQDPSLRLDALVALRASRTTMTEAEYHRRFRDMCIRLSQSGLTRTARIALSAELGTAAAALTLTDRIETTITIAELRLVEHDIDFAYDPLRELVGTLTEAPLDEALKLRFETVAFRICLANYLLEDARNALARAQALAPNDPIIGEMHAEMIVADYLHSGRAPMHPLASDPYACSSVAQARAMRGELEEALAELDAQATAQEAAGVRNEAAWLRMARAELFYNDCRDEEAWSECEKARPLISSLSTSQRLAFERNQRFLSILLNRRDADQNISRTIDQEPTTMHDNTHLSDLVDAEEASREQKHYASLPPLWRELLRHYRTGSWGGRKHAHQRLAHETLAASWLSEAVQHTLLASHSPCNQALAQALIGWRRPDLTDAVVSTILERSFLTSHIEPAAEILALLADVIPDSRMPEVVDWLLATIARAVRTRRSESSLIAVWKATQAVLFRCSQKDIARVFAVARADTFLQQQRTARAAVLDTIGICVQLLENGDWPELATAILPLATTERWIGDFQNVLDLVCQLAQRSAEAKAFITASLFPQGTAGIDVRVAALAPQFGREVPPTGVENMARRIVAALPLQVWHGVGEPPPFTLSMFGTQEGTYEGKRVRIAMIGGNAELEFIRAHKNALGAQDWEALLTTVLDLVAHPLNIRPNRVMLIQFIEEMKDRLTAEQAQTTMGCLRSVFGGATTAPTDMAETATTMRFQIRSTTAKDLHAVALRCSAAVLARFPEAAQREDIAGFHAAFLDPEPVLRQLACQGMKELPEPPTEMELLLMTATQDLDDRVAATALHVATILRGKGALAAHQGLLLVMAQRALVSPAAMVRRLGAHLAVTLKEQTNETGPDDTLAVVLSRARQDAHYSVRVAAGESARSQ